MPAPSATFGSPFILTAVQPEWLTNDNIYWYYGQVTPVSVSPGQTIGVIFSITMADDADGRVGFSLEIEAIQASANALSNQWTTHPW